MSVIKMPIMYSSPGKAVDGRELKQELIDAVQRYDAKIRPAHVKLDAQEAHSNHDTAQNLPALGRVDRIYDGGDGFLWAEVTPTSGYEDILRKLAAPNGPYPNRSIEMDYLDGLGLWLEAISLCGAQRPALNLPAIAAARSPNFQHLTFSVQFANETETGIAEIASDSPVVCMREGVKLLEDDLKKAEIRARTSGGGILAVRAGQEAQRIEITLKEARKELEEAERNEPIRIARIAEQRSRAEKGKIEQLRRAHYAEVERQIDGATVDPNGQTTYDTNVSNRWMNLIWKYVEALEQREIPRIQTELMRGHSTALPPRHEFLKDAILKTSHVASAISWKNKQQGKSITDAELRRAVKQELFSEE